LTAELIIHLVRHAETSSYAGDVGLTEAGTRQAEMRARLLASSLHEDERVELVYAPTERARLTAAVLHETLRRESGPRLRIGGCREDADFRNFQVRVGGEELEPTQARRRLAEARDDQGWAVEAARFWQAHDDLGGAIKFWLTTPLLWHEPPASVVRRFLLAAARHTTNSAHDGHLVVSTHSGCMRALVAWAAGEDRGEPDNVEEVLLSADPMTGRASVHYRGGAWAGPLPTA